MKQYITFVTDRGSNFKYGLLSAGFKRHNCYAHLIHNLVKKMLSKGEAKVMISTAANITAFVKKSNINAQLKKTIKSFSRTRWNGAHAMLESIIDNYDDLVDLLYQRQRKDPKQNYFDKLTTLNIGELKQVCSFLEKFVEITNDIEGESYTLSMVWPIFKSLSLALEADPTDEENEIVQAMKAIGLRYFISRNADYAPTSKHKIATVLDPIFKTLKNVTESERRDVYQLIEEYIRDPIDSSQTSDVIVETSTPNLTSIHPFFHAFYNVDDDVSNTPNDRQKPTELQNYLNQRVAPRCKANEWWNENRDRYPKLFRLFAQISSIPASSASSERVFSRTSLVVTSQRSAILPENVNNLIIVGNKL